MGAPGQGGPHRFRKDPQRAARMPHALEMFGEGATYQQIADEFGYAHRESARELVEDAFAELRGKPDPKAKAREEAKLDLDEATINRLLISIEDDVDATTKLLDRRLRIAERRARLKGLDAPTRVRMSTVTDEDLLDLEAREEAELDELLADDDTDTDTDDAGGEPAAGDDPADPGPAGT